MPELPEVETVKEVLKSQVLNCKIISVNIVYEKIIEYPSILEFKKQILNQTITDIKRRGKWLLFELNDYYLLSHLRMEGKYFIKDKNDKLSKHQHISFILDNDKQLIYQDVRKFGRIYLYSKEEVFNKKPLNELGLEPWDVDVLYLKDKFKNKKTAIKTILLNQSIITGIGNIYVNEILFLSRINPLLKANELNDKQIQDIVDNTKVILNKAIKLGGTTVKSYTSSEGVTGLFQNELLVHTKEICPKCNKKQTKTKVNGRGTYYCEKCQKLK